jgi:hypothetical protein
MTFGRVTYEFQFQQFKPFKPSESDGEISPQRARERGVGQDIHSPSHLLTAEF